MLDYQRVTYFWKHPHVGIVHPRNQLAVVLSVFHDILSSKQRPKVGTGWPGDHNRNTISDRTTSMSNRKQVDVKTCQQLSQSNWHLTWWMNVGWAFQFCWIFSMWEKQFLLRKTWSPGGKPHPMIGNNSWFRTSTARTFAVSIGTRTTTKVLDVKILIVVSNYNKNVSFTCYYLNNDTQQITIVFSISTYIYLIRL